MTHPASTQGPAATGPAPGGLLLAVSATTAIQALATAAVIALTAIAPLVAADIEVPPQWIGYQISIVYLSATVFSILAGTFVRKFGPARISQLCLLIAALGLMGLATGSIAVSILASLALGFAYALPNPAASELLNRLAPPRKRYLIFSLKQTGVPIGGIMIGLVMPGLALWLGWDWALLALAALLMILMLALQGTRGQWDMERDTSLALRAGWQEGLTLVWKRPGLRAMTLMGLLFAAMQLSLVTFLVVMLVEEFGWSPVAAGGALAVVQFAGVLGRLLWGAISDRTGYGAHVLALIGLVTSLCAAALPATLAMPPWILIALLAVFGATSFGWNGVMMAEAARLSPAAQVAPVAGGVLVATFSGVIVGPAVFALIFELSRSYAATFALLAITPLVGAVLIWQGHRVEARLASDN